MLWTEEIRVYVTGLWSYWTWAIKTLAESVDFCRQTSAKWLLILQWLQFFPRAMHLVGRSLDLCWQWVWLPQPGQGLMDLLLSCLGGYVGGRYFHSISIELLIFHLICGGWIGRVVEISMPQRIYWCLPVRLTGWPLQECLFGFVHWVSYRLVGA